MNPLPFLVLCLAGPMSAAEWFVAPSGNDLADGSLDHPFAGLQQAHNFAKPGDTIFIRGGLYPIQEAQIANKRGHAAKVHDFHRSGEKGRPITYTSYKDETPVFDFSQVKPGGMRVHAFSVSGSWLHFKGISITGVQVTIKGHTQSICVESNGSNNIFENLSLHDGQAIGVYHLRGSDNLFLNCDAWNNYDFTSENGRGGNVDGFGCHPTKGSTGNIFRGCRAWFNSDDGFDLISAYESVTIENCWAFYNGYSTQFKSLGDGHGFKAGGYGSTSVDRLPKVPPRHLVQYCLAARNKSSGFYANHHPGGIDWFYNSSYRQGINFLMLNRKPGSLTDVDGYDHRLRHNLSFGSSRDLLKIDVAKCELLNNSFHSDSKISKDDFQSLDDAELLTPRQKDGSLPEIQFLKPAQLWNIPMGAFR